MLIAVSGRRLIRNDNNVELCTLYFLLLQDKVLLLSIERPSSENEKYGAKGQFLEHCALRSFRSPRLHQCERGCRKAYRKALPEPELPL
jgi:hypothetical protein